MRYVEIVKGRPSSVLGFGCAPVLGSVDGDRARKAIDLALDCGINHFDIARSYGFGEAERFVGALLRPVRREIVIATKWGIAATPFARAMAPLKPLVRTARGLLTNKKETSPSLAQPVSVAGSRLFVKKTPLTATMMLKSLHKSLKELRTDYIDLFLMHEPMSLENCDELCELALKQKEAGKIRSWGLSFLSASSISTAEAIQFDVLQHDLSPNSALYGAAKDTFGKQGRVLFSPFGRALAVNGPRLEPSDVLTTMWKDFPNSVVLCSMFDEKHIRENSRLAG